MIDFRNPYTPGAGMTPEYLAGRDEIIDNAGKRIESVLSGYQSRSVVYYGLRGVGKTVLLNAIEDIADNNDLLNRYIEVRETSNFIKAVAIACNGFVQSLSLKEAVKDKIGKLLSIIKSFSATWNPEDKTFTFEIKNQPLEFATAGTGDLSNDLTELLVALGRYAQQANTPICFCIDEIQYAKNEELEALITAVHRLNQLRLPVIFFCAGLPKILKTMGDVKTYSERLFEFIEINSLSDSSAEDAIIIPAEKLGVSYSAEAIRKIIESTEGYPYFIQEMCSTIWENHEKKKIEAGDVHASIERTNEKLDTGFFQVRYDRCTQTEKSFMTAMVKCGRQPCTIADVAVMMGRKVSSVYIFRSSLIGKGLIYSTRYGEIDFTVPTTNLLKGPIRISYRELTMKIFITGAAGYIGSHTAIELISQGYDVVCADNFSNSRPEAAERVKKLAGADFPFYNMDVRDETGLDEVFSAHEIGCVMHFAGMKAVGESVRIPLSYYANNLDSTIALCNAMQKHGVRKMAYSSSATVYNGGGTMPLTEDAATGDCSNPYGWTKFMCERILRDAASANGDWAVALLRYFNPIGAHESGEIGEDPLGVPNNLMPYIAQVAVGRLESLSVFGNDYDTVDGTGVRDYVHVSDLAKGHVAAVKYLEGHPGTCAFNLGTGRGTSVLELVSAFEKASGVSISKKIEGRRAGDLPVCYADVSKAKRELGWAAEKTIGDACADSWRWQSKNPKGYL